MQLEHVSEFKYLGYIMDESGTDKAVSRRKVGGVIRSLVNARSLQLECARVLHEISFGSVLMYGSETVIWKEEERSRIREI